MTFKTRDLLGRFQSSPQHSETPTTIVEPSTFESEGPKMVYESDFYTTRRYRTSPSVSTYTVSYAPSRQVRLLPGVGKVHVVHTYDRIVPYVGHKRLTVVTPPPQIFKVRPSVLLKEFDRISYKYRPPVAYSYVNNYLNSDSAVRTYYIRDPITDYRYTYLPSSVYYHNVIRRPLRLYYDILGLPRYSRYWYRYWYNVPSLRYSDYYNYDYYRYWPSYWYRSYSSWPSVWSRWHNYWSPTWYKYKYPATYDWSNSWHSKSSYSEHSSLTSWYPSITNWYPTLRTSWYNYLSPYWSKLWTNSDLPYNWSVYWTPSWSRYWRLYWSNYWSRYYDLIFNDETSRIRADAAGLMKRIHAPVVRSSLTLLPYSTRYSDVVPSRFAADEYIHKIFSTSPHNAKVQYTTYYSEPVRKYIGPGHLAAVTYAGGKAYERRRQMWSRKDPVKDDIQLLSYYISKFRNEPPIKKTDNDVEEQKQAEISAA